MDKILIVIMDGASDRPTKKRLSPLQQARKPNIDELARAGSTGIMDVISPGIPPGSDTAHLALLGYNPFEVYFGRGPFEAAGMGLELKPGDVAFRCNFGSVNENFRVLDRRAGRIKERTEELAKAIDGLRIEDVKIIFKAGVEHRGVLVLRGKELSSACTDIDPHREKVNINFAKPTSLAEASERTARILNKFVKESYSILSKHEVNIERAKKGLPPANIILPRGAGSMPKLESLSKKFKLQGACIAGVPLVKGVCKLADLDIIDIKGATGGVDTDLRAKFTGAAKALEQKYDFVFVNIKAPDIYGHDGNYEGKVKIIQKIDKACKILKEIDCLKVITSDHSTPCSVRDHSADPAPLALTGEGVAVDKVKKLDEQACAEGALHRIKGSSLINICLDLVNRAKKFGA